MKPPNDQPTRIADVPLPGHYECLTMQLNVTLYPSPGTAKYVCIVRDPSPDKQVELSRSGGILNAVGMVERLAEAFSEALAGMLYMGQVPVP